MLTGKLINATSQAILLNGFGEAGVTNVSITGNMKNAIGTRANTADTSTVAMIYYSGGTSKSNIADGVTRMTERYQ